MLSFQNASQHSTTTLIDILNNAFEGYIAGSIRFDQDSFHSFCSTQGINLSFSQVALKQNRPVGLALVTRKGWTSRLAAMGIVKDVQNQAIGTALMHELICQAKKRSDRHYELEVIEQNPAGVRLYEKIGFKQLGRLRGATLRNPKAQQSTKLEPIDLLLASAFIAEHGDANLPWQLSAYHVSQLAEPNKAFFLDDAMAVVSDPSKADIRIHHFIVAKEQRFRNKGKTLFSEIIASFPNKTWHVPALCPERYYAFFEAQGFKETAISQFHMRLALN